MWISPIERENLVNTVILNGPLLFSSITALMGMRFDREEGAGPVYKIYMAGLFVLGVYPIIKSLFKGKFKSKYVLPLLIIFLYIIMGFFQLHDNTNFLLQMGCFAVPAVCVGLTMDQQEGLKGMMKWFEVFLPFLAVSFVFMIRNMMFVKLEGEVNSYDQSASYYAAFLFIVILYILRHNREYPKFNFLDNKWYRLAEILMLPYFFVVCFFAGGRGAVLLIFVGLFFQIDLIKKIPAGYYWKGFFILIVLSILVYIGIGELSGDYFDLLEHNYERVSALIEGGHVDTSASSGRDNIWRDAFNTWSASPLFGYGLFSYLDHFYIRPHNFVLEIMLQGGLALLSTLFYILIRSFIKYRRMLKTDKSQIFLMPLLLFTFTELSVSGSYWFEPFFWFVLVYIYSFNLKKAKNIKLLKY